MRKRLVSWLVGQVLRYLRYPRLPLFCIVFVLQYAYPMTQA
jgi:hypothetical protein